MSTEPINYEAVLADLRSRRSQLDTAIAAIEGIMGIASSGGPTPPGTGGGATPPLDAKPASDAFLGMSIPEATKKHLSAMFSKDPTTGALQGFADSRDRNI